MNSPFDKPWRGKSHRRIRIGKPQENSQKTKVSNTPDYYHDDSVTVHQWTSCPIEVDRLPWIPSKAEFYELPPPFCDGQEMTHFVRNRWGHLLATEWYLAFEGTWTLLASIPTPLKHWQNVIPIP